MSRRRAGAGASWGARGERGLLLAAATATLLGCGGGEAAPPTGSPSSRPPSASPPADPDPQAADPSLSADGGIDCAAVARARNDLLAATNAELSRLEVDRSDRAAFGVTLLVAAQQAPAYWSTVREALTPDADERLRTEVGDVAAHWASLSDDLAAVEATGGSTAAVRRALDELDAVTSAVPSDQVAAVQVAQTRSQTAVDRACGEALTAGRGITPGDPGAYPGPGTVSVPPRA